MKQNIVNGDNYKLNIPKNNKILIHYQGDLNLGENLVNLYENLPNGMIFLYDKTKKIDLSSANKHNQSKLKYINHEIKFKEKLTVAENLQIFNENINHIEINELSHWLGLDIHSEDYMCNNNRKQRYGMIILMTLLIQDCDLIVIDNRIFSILNFKQKQILFSYLNKKSCSIVIFSESNMREYYKFFNEILHIQHGQITGDFNS